MDDVSYHTHTLYAGSCDEMDGWMGTIEGVNAAWWYVVANGTYNGACCFRKRCSRFCESLSQFGAEVFLVYDTHTLCMYDI